MTADLPPMSETDLAEIATRRANTSPGMAFDITMGGSTLRATADTKNPHRIVASVSDLVETFTGVNTGPVTATFADDEEGQDATFALNAANDIARLLAEVDSRGRANDALSERCEERGRELDAALRRVADLEQLKCEVCGMRVAHLNCNGHVIGWGCAGGDNCKDDRLVQARAAGWDEGYEAGCESDPDSLLPGNNPYRAPGMPHTPTEGADPEHQPVSYRIGTLTSLTCTCQAFAVSYVGAPPTEAEMASKHAEHLDEVASAEDEREYRCRECDRWALWTDGDLVEDNDGVALFWCQNCSAEMRLDSMESRPREADPQTPVPTPQPVADGPGTVQEGTGEREPHGRTDPVVWGQGAGCPHRPEWHCEAHGECRGCECGCDTVNPEVEEWGVLTKTGRLIGPCAREVAENLADNPDQIVHRYIGPWESVAAVEGAGR